MGVLTTFNEKKELARSSISIAIEHLISCIGQDTWGRDDVTDDYIDELHLIISDLVKIKRKL